MPSKLTLEKQIFCTLPHVATGVEETEKGDVPSHAQAYHHDQTIILEEDRSTSVPANVGASTIVISGTTYPLTAIESL